MEAVVPPTPSPSPEEEAFGGTPAVIPGTIQAEDFDGGGEGVGYSDTDTPNNGGVRYCCCALFVNLGVSNGKGEFIVRLILDYGGKGSCSKLYGGSTGQDYNRSEPSCCSCTSTHDLPDGVPVRSSNDSSSVDDEDV